MIKTILFYLTTAALSFVFLSAGYTKLGDHINPEMHHQLVKNFKIWGAPTGHPDEFRLAVGSAEIATALLLWIPTFSSFANLLLIAIMLGAVGVHIQHAEPLLVPAVLAGLLAFRYLLIPSSSAAAAQKKKKSK